jgi:hypothetical protein
MAHPFIPRRDIKDTRECEGRNEYLKGSVVLEMKKKIPSISIHNNSLTASINTHTQQANRKA